MYMRTSATPSGTTQANGKAAGCGIDGNIPSYNTGNVRLLNMCEWKVQWQLSIRVSRCSHGFDRRTMHRNIHNRFAGHAERYVQLGDIVNLLLDSGEWLNKPSSFQIKDDSVIVDTDPETDFWQRSYYGFRNDNAPALLFDSEANFTITVKVGFNYQKQFDQCGLIIYLDSENWFKASIEYENNQFSRLEP